MTSYEKSQQKPDNGDFIAFDHIHFWVGNAYQAAAYYICRFGFEPYAYRGLETGSRQVTTQVVCQNDIIFAFSSPLTPPSTTTDNNCIASVMNTHTSLHGDGVKEIAFQVNNCQSIYEYAILNGAKSIQPPQQHNELEHDNSFIVIAIIEAPYKDTWHTFIQRNNYKSFLPGYKPIVDKDPQIEMFEQPNLQFIDHCVANQYEGTMESIADWYIRTLRFHRFWSVDDKQLFTKYSSLRSIVVTDYNERIKIPINEPAKGVRKSQIQEFIDYYGGPGIQHIALNTNNIIFAIDCLRKRGVSFIQIPNSYYHNLKLKLKLHNFQIQQDLDTLQRLGILIDFDQYGYLLQIFTKPLQDRPTFFLEIIQRYSHSGFGVGNFKSLFEAIEREQGLRGNL